MQRSLIVYGCSDPESVLIHLVSAARSVIQHAGSNVYKIFTYEIDEQRL